MVPSTLAATAMYPGEVIQMPTDDVKYIEVEVKTPGFALFKRVIPIRGHLSVMALVDRFHNLHSDVEGTIKKCGFMYPPIDWHYIHSKMDIVIQYNKSEWVRLRRVDKPT